MNPQQDNSYAFQLNKSYMPPPLHQQRPLAYVGQRSLPELNSSRDLSPPFANFPVAQKPILPSTNLPFFPGYQMAIQISPERRKNKKEESKLLSHIERQNQMLEKLALKIGEQQNSYLDRERRDLEEKYRLMQMENNLRMQEIKLQEMMEKNTKREEKPKKKKPREKNQYMDMLSKLILAKGSLKKSKLLDLIEDESSEEDEYQTARNHSPSKLNGLDHFQFGNNRNFNPVSLPSGRIYKQDQGPMAYSPTKRLFPDSPTRLNYQSPRANYPMRNYNGGYSPYRQPMDPSGYSPTHSPVRNGYYPGAQFQYRQNPYSPTNNQYQYPNPYGQPSYPSYGQYNPNEAKGDIQLLSEEELLKRKKKREQTLKKKKEEDEQAAVAASEKEK